MPNDRPPPEKPTDRRQRLAAALRENLKRRKAQARARADDERPATPPPAERTDRD